MKFIRIALAALALLIAQQVAPVTPHVSWRQVIEKSFAPRAAYALTPNVRNLLFSGPPGWVVQKFGPNLATHVTFAADDTTGRYYVRGVGQVSESSVFSNSRASTRWAQNASGVYVSAAAGQTNIQSGVGAYLYEARTNKCTNYNAAPTNGTNISPKGTATVTEIAVGSLPSPVQSSLISSGLSEIVTSVYKVVTVANFDGINFVGAVGNTNPHTLSAWVYVESGGAVNVQLSSTTFSWPSTSFSTWSRLVAQNVTPGNTTGVLQVQQATPGTFYVILNELQETTFAIPSPVVVAGSSATVGADIRQLIGPAATAALAAKGAYVETNAVAGISTNARLLTFSSGLSYYQNTTTVAIASDGIHVATATLGSGTISGIVKSASSMGASGVSIIANGGAKATDPTNWSNTGIVYEGNQATGVRALNGIARWLAFFDVDPTTYTGLTTP
jgi:hypothetical protein